MKNKITPYLENISEAGCACLITMVQGNIFAITAGHWLIALETGLIAGLITSTAIISIKFRKQWLVSLTLGVITAVSDFFVHTGMIGTTAVIEAVVTGVGAFTLSYSVNLIIIFLHRKKHRANAG